MIIYRKTLQCQAYLAFEKQQSEVRLSGPRLYLGTTEQQYPRIDLYIPMREPTFNL